MNKSAELEKLKPISDKFDLGGVEVFLAEPGIVVSHYYQDLLLDIELAKKVNKLVGELSEGKALPQLFIACPGQTVTKEVRDWSADEISNQFTLCTAVVCNSLAHRILGNFFIKVQRPARPTKLFNDIKSAWEWLLSHVQ